MTQSNARELKNGIYRLDWKHSGWSLATVGALHDGEKWFAPANWTSNSPNGIASTKWALVKSATPITTKEIAHP